MRVASAMALWCVTPGWHHPRPHPRYCRMFSGAGLPARVVTDAEADQKTHAAWLPAFVGALYSAGGDIRLVGRRHDLLHLFVSGCRDALSALQADGTAIRLRMTRALVWAPEWLLHVGLRRFLDTELAVVGGQAHAIAAIDEMRELAEELRVILRRTGLRSPANDQAYGAITAWAGDTAARGG